MVYSAQSKMLNSLLNEAIGWGFASEKRKEERKAMGKCLSDEMNNCEEEDEEDLE
jgi:hypothetical protein